MQIAAHPANIFRPDDRTLESALKQMPAIKVDRVRGLLVGSSTAKGCPQVRGHCDQMKMIRHQDITIHFDPVVLCSFSEIAQRLPSISMIPENLFPSISARHDMVNGTGKLQSKEVVAQSR
jgi:hypothetical protein